MNQPSLPTQLSSTDVHPKAGVRRSVRGFLGEQLVVVLWSVIALLIAYRMLGRATDDIYITYRYAWNLAHGAGLVFNPGERVFGVTDPGVALLLGWLHWISRVEVPRLGSLLTAAWLVGAGRVLLRGAARNGLRLEGILGGTLLVTSPYLWTAQGAGPLAVLAFLLAAAARAERWPTSAGLSAGLAVWMRPDAAPAAMLLGLLRGRLVGRFPRRYALVCGLVVLAGCVAAWSWFGTVVPNTLAAKRQFAALGPELVGATPAVFWGRAWGLFRQQAGPLALPLAALGLAGQAWLWWRCGLPGKLLVLHAALTAVAYTFLGVPFFVWYAAPAAAALLFAIPFPLVALARRAGGFRLAALLAAALALAPLLGTVRWLHDGGRGDWRLPAYRAAGSWLREHTPPDATVAADEIGILAYTSRRRVVDLIGLVSPEAMPYAAAGDLVGAFLARPADYLLFHSFTRRGGSRPIVTKPWFDDAYEAAVRLRLAQPPGTVTIYRRRPGAPLPPRRPPRQRSAIIPNG